MKKSLIGMLILVILICNYAGTIVYAVNETSIPTPTASPAQTEVPTLEEICNKFNSEKSPLRMAFEENLKYKYKASFEENKIYIVVSDKDGNSSKIEYTLEKTILSGHLNYEIKENTVVILLINCIGMLHGYKESDYILPDNFEDASVEKEGYEIRTEEDKVDIKIDISKKPVLINSTELAEQAVNDVKENVNKVKDNTVDNAKTIFIEGTNIVKNALDDMEKLEEQLKESAINRNNNTNTANSTESQDNTNNETSETQKEEDNNTTNTETMPKTGKEQNPILIIPYVAIAFTCIGIIALILTRKRCN